MDSPYPESSSSLPPAYFPAQEDYLRVAQALKEMGIITPRDLKLVETQGSVAEARFKANHKDRRVPTALETLLQVGVTHPEGGSPWELEELYKKVAELKGLGFERLDPLRLDLELLTTSFSRAFAQRHLMLALREENGEIVVATARLFDEEGQRIARQTLRRRVRFVATLPQDVERIIRDHYGFRSSIEKAEKAIRSPEVDISNLEQLVRLRGEKELEASQEHVINAVDYLFRHALDLKASDIHMEPKREEGVIRFRMDGVLHRMYTIPRPVYLAMVSRIKLLARMDIAERRRPQDGRIKTVDQERPVEMRVSTLPVAFGEKVVIRIFDPSMMTGDLATLGFRDEELKLFQRWIHEPHGIILVTGPTGSGKSTTLYTALLNVATEAVNVVTIEDPIEMIHESFNQVAVQPQVGITFSSALRTILRQDPDIIMVGEIRDRETAQYAIQAALTGHLVFSTLHTNDAPTAIPRMNDLGVEPFLLSSALIGVMAQRLVRKVCPHCAVEKLLPSLRLNPLGVRIPPEELVPILYGQGCPRCRQTGYLGRIAIFEMMEVNDSMRELISRKASLEEIREIASKNGMRTLKEAGASLVLEGITTIEEVLRVTGGVAQPEDDA